MVSGADKKGLVPADCSFTRSVLVRAMGSASDEAMRFCSKSESEVEDLLKSAIPENTRKATEVWVSALKSFCAQEEIQLDMKTCSAEELNSVLCKFYPALRSKKGELYKKSSYLAARAAIHRRVRELERPFNVFSSQEFSRSHGVLNATLKKKKAEGDEPLVQHKDAITEEDRTRLEVYFDDVLTSNDPVKLTQYIWYHMTLHFGLRGREVQARMKKTDIEFRADETGEFVVLTRDFCSKNCQGGIGGREFVTAGRLQDSKQVAAFRLLLSKLHPDNERLFQRARQGRVAENDKTWFTRQVLGHNLMGSMMDRLCTHAGLSKRYTNHCVRSTTVTLLKSAGVEDRTVCLVTGHKSEKSLSSYEKVDSAKCKVLARCLDSAKGESLTGSEGRDAAGSSVSPGQRYTDGGSEGVCDWKIVAPGAVFNNLTISVNAGRTSGAKRKLSLSTCQSAKKRMKVNRAGPEQGSEINVEVSSQVSMDADD